MLMPFNAHARSDNSPIAWTKCPGHSLTQNVQSGGSRTFSCFPCAICALLSLPFLDQSADLLLENVRDCAAPRPIAIFLRSFLVCFGETRRKLLHVPRRSFPIIGQHSVIEPQQFRVF